MGFWPNHKPLIIFRNSNSVTTMIFPPVVTSYVLLAKSTIPSAFKLNDKEEWRRNSDQGIYWMDAKCVMLQLRWLIVIKRGHWQCLQGGGRYGRREIRVKVIYEWHATRSNDRSSTTVFNHFTENRFLSCCWCVH